jgi:hypothetical protein
VPRWHLHLITLLTIPSRSKSESGGIALSSSPLFPLYKIRRMPIPLAWVLSVPAL